MPEMIPVQSSSVEAIGYDARARALYVRFLKLGRTYRYAGVTAQVYQELMRAESKGRFVNIRIKPNYPCTKVRSR